MRVQQPQSSHQLAQRITIKIIINKTNLKASSFSFKTVLAWYAWAMLAPMRARLRYLLILLGFGGELPFRAGVSHGELLRALRARVRPAAGCRHFRAWTSYIISNL